jgi:hypothetical protein
MGDDREERKHGRASVMLAWSGRDESKGRKGREREEKRKRTLVAEDLACSALQSTSRLLESVGLSVGLVRVGADLCGKTSEHRKESGENGVAAAKEGKEHGDVRSVPPVLR